MQASGSKRRAALALTALTTPAVLLSTLARGHAGERCRRETHSRVPLRVTLSSRCAVSPRSSVPGVTVDAVLELDPQRAGPRLGRGAAPAGGGARRRWASWRTRRSSRPATGCNQTAGSVFSWQGLGDEAGRPGAGRGVHVALIDTGVSDSAYPQPGLRPPGRRDRHLRLLVHRRLGPTQGVFDDGYGHGTFMASLIAGGGSVKRGHTLGVAPGAIVDVVKVAGADGVVLVRLDDGRPQLGSAARRDRGCRQPVLRSRPGRDVGGYGQDPLNLATSRPCATWAPTSWSPPATRPVRSPTPASTRGSSRSALRTRAAGGPSGAPSAAAPSWPVSASRTWSRPASACSACCPPARTIVAANPLALQPNGFYRGSGTSEATAVVSGLAALFVADNPGRHDRSGEGLAAGCGRLRSTLTGSGAGLANVANRLARSRDDWQDG